MNTFKMAKVFYRCVKVVKFRQIWSNCQCPILSTFKDGFDSLHWELMFRIEKSFFALCYFKLLSHFI